MCKRQIYIGIHIEIYREKRQEATTVAEEEEEKEHSLTKAVACWIEVGGLNYNKKKKIVCVR